LREPLSGLSRADCVVITRTDQANNVEALRNEVLRHAGNVPVFQSQMRIKNGAETIPSPVAAFCGVGNPRSFFRQIQHEVVFQKTFPDHHRYSQAEIDSLIEAAKHVGAQSLVTTAKDAVKLKSISFGDLPCYVLEIEPEIENAAELAGLIVNSVKE
jgi:tetraacyldisaccharide 4'-kinase